MVSLLRFTSNVFYFCSSVIRKLQDLAKGFHIFVLKCVVEMVSALSSRIRALQLVRSCSTDVTIVTSMLALPLIASASQGGVCAHHHWKLLLDDFLELITSAHDLCKLAIA